MGTVTKTEANEKPKTKNILVRFPHPLWKRAKLLSVEKEISLHEAILEAVREYTDKHLPTK